MRIPIENMAEMTGDYDGDELILQSTVATTEIVDGINATKVPSKTLWAGGTMTYTVTIENTTLIDYESPVFTDTLDSHITLVEGSVKVNDVAVTYTYAAQLLTINLDTIPAEDSIVVTFDVKIA